MSRFSTLSNSWLRARAEEDRSAFVSAREAQSQALASGATEIVASTLELAKRHELLTARLYRVRRVLDASDAYRSKYEDWVANASLRLLMRHLDQGSEAISEDWIERYRAIWRREFPLFLFTLAIFLLTVLVGWQAIMADPTLITAFVGPEMVEKVLEHQRWFDRIQGNPLMAGLGIAMNNMKVAVNTYLGGALLGLGGFFFLSFNGLMLGALLAFCRLHGFESELAVFVVGHGPLELTLIVASAFSSFVFGRVFYSWPYDRFGDRLSRAARDALHLILGIVPWLILAALIESFVSPWRSVGMAERFWIGLAAAALFWGWTFWPKGLQIRVDRRRS